MNRPLQILLACLALGVGCKPPSAAEAFERNLGEAAHEAEAAVAEGDREAYRSGFSSGARMVEGAARDGRRPYALKLGRTSGALLPASGLPTEVTVVDEGAPEVELDAETGLEIFRFAPSDRRGFTSGQVDGFRWALQRRRAELVRPRPEPVFPAVWERLEDTGQARLAGGHQQVELIWRPGVLAWTWREGGFPGRRTWRPAPAWMRPESAALVPGALWIDTERGALALDLESGVLRAVRPRPVSAVPAELTPEAFMAAQRKEAEKARPMLLAKAAQGDAEAMVALGQDAEDLVEEVDWYRRAAEAGSAEGLYHLAVCCFQGRGVPEDKAEARRWFQRAAAAGHAGAREALAGLFPDR